MNTDIWEREVLKWYQFFKRMLYLTVPIIYDIFAAKNRKID